MSILQDLLALKKIEPIVEDHDTLEGDQAAEAAEELHELHEEMVKSMSRVREIVRSLPRMFRGQAEAYFIPHIMIALGGEHEWMTAGHESTLAKLIEELREYDDRPESDDDDEQRRADKLGDGFGRDGEPY